MIALAAIYPMDQVRLLKQVEGSKGVFANQDKNKLFGVLAPVLTLFQARGVGGIYKGIYAQQIALGVSNFIYFYIKNLLSVAAAVASSKTLSTTQEFVVTTIAGAVNAVAAAPLWNICDKIKTDNTGQYNGVIDCARQLTVCCAVIATAHYIHTDS